MSLFEQEKPPRRLYCEVPGCPEADVECTYARTCVVWGGHRLGYACGHFDAFADHSLGLACERRGLAPSPEEWVAFVVDAKAQTRKVAS